MPSRFAYLSCLLAGITACSHANPRAPSPAPQQPAAVEPLYVQSYRSTSLSAHPRLVVVLHGDAPFQPPDYQYTLARLIAQENTNVVALGMLRPGYADPEGHRSPGDRGEGTGDNYTPEVVRAVAATIRHFREAESASRVLIVAHSGGAAIAGDLLGLVPDLVDDAVLVSCPCDVPRFRAHMKELRADSEWKALWSAPVRSLSPADLVGTIAPRTRVVLITGAEDDVAPPALARAYAKRLQARHIAVRVVLLPGQGHEVFLEKDVRTAVSQLLTP